MNDATRPDRFPSLPGAVILLTSYFWEGSAVLQALVRHQVGLTDLVIQRPWWGRRSAGRARMGYFVKSLRYNAGSRPRRYQSLAGAARRHGVRLAYVDDINIAGLEWQADNVALIVVAGSRIIKPPVVERFRGRIVNFHSGLLPYYRGPYSEFWAMYQHRPDRVGVSVHLIDEGIDTGPLLATHVADLPAGSITPQEAHHVNVLQGVQILAETVAAYLRDEIRPTPQPAEGNTYMFPSRHELQAMQARVGRRFRVDFIE